MKKSIDVTWKNNMQFETIIDNHKLILDAVKEVGGNDAGPPPKPLMLVSLGGCTGMDVVSLLNKMRVKFDYFNVRIEGDLADEHPKRFTKMKIIYELKGTDIDKSKVEKAVNLSIEKYCGVSAVYKQALELTHEIIITNS